MTEIKSIILEDLIVWSDNPRHGLQISDDKLSETEVINILIDVVGEEKMYKLIEDIFNKKGLLPNIMPVVVQNGKKYYVYDGNRRVSALKIIKNPSIVERDTLRNRVKKMVENVDITFTDAVSVCITQEQDALEIMDNLHSGEQDGVGMISWEPYQRDISLFKRGKILKYSSAFKVCQALQYNMKSFTKETPTYTDLDRLFGSRPLLDYFKIKENEKDYATKIKNVIKWLEEYKKAENFNSYSRKFNSTGSHEDGPIKEFCAWVDEQKKKMKTYEFKSKDVDIFENENFSFDKLKFNIYDKNNKKVKYTQDELSLKYFSPNGKESDILDVKKPGRWIISINYKNEQYQTAVNVKKLSNPKIDFTEQRIFKYGNTVNLKDLVIRAENSRGENCMSNLEISSITDCEIINDVFTDVNSLGTYEIKFSILDFNGTPYSKTYEIQIVDELNPLLPENKNRPLLSTNSEYCIIDISEVVNEMISEINNLDYKKNICIIVVALRTLLELTFEELQSKKIMLFTKPNDIQASLSEFKQIMLNNKLEELCKKYKQVFPSYHTEKNSLELLDSIRISSYLNLATHKSTSRIDITQVSEIARKSIVPILMYASLMIKGAK